MKLPLTILSVGDGSCHWSEKDCDGLTVTFDDGTFTETFVSWQTFKRMVKMKFKAGKTTPRPAVKPAVNGAPPAEAPK